MKGATKGIDRDYFQPKWILASLNRGGEIGDKEAKRLLEEGCHAYIDLLEKLKAIDAHAGAIDCIMRGII